MARSPPLPPTDRNRPYTEKETAVHVAVLAHQTGSLAYCIQDPLLNTL